MSLLVLWKKKTFHQEKSNQFFFPSWTLPPKKKNSVGLFSPPKKNLLDYSRVFIPCCSTIMYNCDFPGTFAKLLAKGRCKTCIPFSTSQRSAHMALGARVALRRPAQNHLKIGVRREGTVSNGLLESLRLTRTDGGDPAYICSVARRGGTLKIP